VRRFFEFLLEIKNANVLSGALLGIVAFFAPKCLSNLWPRENGRVLPNDLSEFIKRFDLGQLPQVVNQDVNDVANYYGS